ncbi:anaphase promoting complex subunit 5 [Cadophora gregata]|uniref:anaphase promoting complex subunit 5 n=1 Tax=Cadophora gregata TaxID=51156 RepID=UPI0026DD61B0|nr:anaphase promoting complex subunit 5 [Cadophora gregata]KAK0111320.1 anaphase promoting complex subunit 5 [Cadophora gregata]
MTRFLTPAKIGLLALIELYTDAIVPNSSTIPILSFILNQLLPSAFKSQTREANLLHTIPFILDLKSFESLLTRHSAAAGLPGRSLWDHFLRKLWEVDNLDALHLFFVTRGNLLARYHEEIKKDEELGIPPPSDDMILLSRTSPLGSFIRRAKVEYERLRFSDALSLWIAFVQWREESRLCWARRNGGLERWAGNRALAEGQQEWGLEATEILEHITYGALSLEGSDKGGLSTDDVEKLLEFQVEQMQKLGNRIPDDVKRKFRSIMDKNIIIPSLSHYLNFLDAWRAGDYPTSFDNLHRYFDYTMQNRDRLFYQYALMNLAVLQADFGCFDEAVAAMLETVSIARENKDMACLNFALNWLYHFGKAHPKIMKRTDSTNILGVEREGLAFLRIKAKETGMWTLWSSSLLSEAKLGMSNGESVATALENLLKSSQLIVEKNMKSMMGPQIAMHSSLWGRLGVARLSRQYCDIFLSCHSRFALFDDTLRFTCRVAHLLVERGRYDEAMEKLEGLDANSLRSWKSNQYWLKYRGILRLKRYLHRNDLSGADCLISQLLQCNGSETDTDLAFETNTLHIDYLIRRTNYGRALAKIEQLAFEMKADGDDLNLRIKLLTMKALLQDKAGRPQKGFSIAVRAASIAWRARLIPALWGAMGSIANIMTSLSEFQASCQILIAIIPRALEYENCTLNAQLYSFLADAYMGLAGQAEPGSMKRKQNLTRCLEFVGRAFDEYSAVEDIKGQSEMMAKKATIMKIWGENILANDYASGYLDLKKGTLV